MSEVGTKIRQCIAELEPYRIFSSDIERAIATLKELENLIKDLNQRNAEKALGIVTEFLRDAEEYSSYIPITVSNLKFIKEWLEKSRK